MKRKRSPNNPSLPGLRHLFLQKSHPTLGRLILAWLWLLSLHSGLVALRAGDAGGWNQTNESGPSSTAAHEKDQREALESQFLVFGTVLIDPGFALRGAEVGVKPAGERKMRWRTRTNGRGEFAVRVPKGAEYEVVVSAKCCAEMTRKVDARNSSRADLVFKLEPKPGGKKK